MSKTELFAVISLALLTLSIESQAENDELPYNNLERELSVRVPNDDPDMNIKEIDKMIKTMSPRESSLTLDDFRLLLTLLQLKSDNQCSKFTRDIFLTNSVKDIIRNASSPGRISQSSRRLEKLLNHYSKKHAQDCHDKYLDVLNSKIKTMDKRKLAYLTFYTDTILNEHYDVEEPGKTVENVDSFELYENFIKPKELAINEIKDGEIAFDVIRTLDEVYNDQKDANPTSFTPTIEQKISREASNYHDHYLVEPCEDYVDELGPSVFEPVALDAEFFQDISRRPRQFYLAWARFSLCSIVVEDSIMSMKIRNIAENFVKSSRN